MEDEMAASALTPDQIALAELATTFQHDSPAYQQQVYAPLRALEERHRTAREELRARWQQEDEELDRWLAEHERIVLAARRSHHTVFPGEQYRKSSSPLKRLYGWWLDHYWTTPY